MLARILERLTVTLIVTSVKFTNHVERIETAIHVFPSTQRENSAIVIQTAGYDWVVAGPIGKGHLSPAFPTKRVVIFTDLYGP